MKQVLDSALESVIPTPEELVKINEIVEILTILLKNKAKELGIEFTDIEPQGSTGIKQTQLRDDFDIDLFIGLPIKNYEHKFEKLSRNQFKKNVKKDFKDLCNEWIIPALSLKEFQDPRLLYAEHPYVTARFKDLSKDIDIKIDIVLYFDLAREFILKKGPITAVDRSPWHGRFVRDSLNHAQKNHVRLLKQFFKACHSYGDKSAVGKVGFIGYSAELLIYHFKTIDECFKNFSSLNTISLDYHGRNSKELAEIPHFQEDCLIITDPIDQNRNVASAISERAYEYVNFRVQEFLLNPREEFFKIQPIKLADVVEFDGYFVLECKIKSEETHYTISRDKLYSLGDSIKANGEKEFSHDERFGTIEFEVYFEEKKNEYAMALFCERPLISSHYPRRGPPVKAKHHAEKFKEKNPNFIIRDGYYWTETKRDHVKFIDFLKEFVNERISNKLAVVNIAEAQAAQTETAKKALTVLKEMVLPFI